MKTTAPQNIGRPPLPRGEKRDATYLLKLRPAELQAVQAAARASDKPLAEWIRGKILTRDGRAK